MRNYFCIFLVTTGIQLIYAQQLQTVSGKLSELAAKLHYDRDIQDDINRLAHDGQQVATSFKRMLEADSGKILAEKNRLVKTSDPTDVKVDTLRKILQAARYSLTSEQKDISTLEQDIHSSIETCNGRRKDHATNRLTTQQKLETIPIEIASLEDNIKTVDESINTLEESARELDNQAWNLRRQASQKRGDGILCGVLGGFIGGILGYAFAPFTGGASLAIAAGFLVGVNLNDADDCDRNARRFRDDATSKRKEARTLRTKRDTLETETRALESQIRTLQTSSDELQQAADGLYGVSSYLRSSLDVTNEVLRAIENMDTAMKEAELQGNSFEILQSWLARYPESVGAKSQSYLDKLKEKWTRLEKILVQHGAKASLE